MRAYDNGAFFTVTVNKSEVASFKSHFPCSGLATRGISFQFDKRNGDLVAVSSKCDGPGLLALSQDAQAYGVRRLKLEGVN